jgi:hypothetical protein
MSGTDEQIKDAYARLEGALAPPLDVAERVQRRVVVRRRRRRVVEAGAAAVLAVAAIGGAVALSGGDDPSGSRTAVDQPPGPVSTLVMTRPDGSTYAFEDVEVTCTAPDGDEPQSGPQRIWAISPRTFEHDRAVEPFVYFDGIVSKIRGDRTFTFPNDWSTTSDEYPMVLFMADSEGKDGNEVASSAGGESGTVRVLEASCTPSPTLRLEVDMTLGSEEGKQPLDVAGTLD